MHRSRLCNEYLRERANESKIAYNKQRNLERYHVKPKKVFRESRHKNYERQ